MKAKPTSPEYAAFENILGKVLTVSKTDLDARLKQEKREKQIPKSASRVSGDQAKRS